jgi:TolB-like protein/tetratricopeptide (TPR) repeat protein
MPHNRRSGGLEMAQGGGEDEANGRPPAVFISYASQDAEAAKRICDALRAAGIEVWFDQSELRGGDVWDQRIRREIRDCTLFMPVISANTVSRHEGYFRLEWDLADQRTHMIARDRAFIVPVCLDATKEAGTDVPESFNRVQWTRLPGGQTPPEFAARIARLLSPQPQPSAGGRQTVGSSPVLARYPLAANRPAPLWRALRVTAAALAAAALAWLLIDRPWSRGQGPAVPPATTGAVAEAPRGATPAAPASAAFSPPPHSIAVLPFVNLSGDKEQEYFSDGLTEELLNSLAEIDGLQVAARTSSFSFEEHPDIATVARKLNVAAVLEGSVRRSAHTIRVTAQLINAATGFHLWSKTYDRDLGDVLKLQTEIATAVATSLKITLLGDVGEKIELGGTRNAAAFDAYLRGLRQTRGTTNAEEARLPISTFTEAIRLDPDYALAYAGRSLALSLYNGYFAQLAERRDLLPKARADAERAIALAPTLSEAHLALALFLDTTLDFTRAEDEYKRALALAPGNALVLYRFALHAARTGRSEAALPAAQRSVALDPLNVLSHQRLGDVLYYAHRYNEAIAAYTDAIAVDPAPPESYARRGWSYYLLGNLKLAQSSCQIKADFYQSLVCLAITLDKLGRHDEAEAILPKLAQAGGDVYAYQFAQIYAQWGNQGRALDWLDTAMRLRDTGLTGLKTDPLLDPLRDQPRFQAIERKLKFPH